MTAITYLAQVKDRDGSEATGPASASALDSIVIC